MHLKGHGLLVLVALLLCSTSCGIPGMIGAAMTPPRMVKVDSKYLVTDYTADALYALKQPVFLVKRDSRISGDFPEYAIVPPGDIAADAEIPKSIEEYDRLGPRRFPKVVEALPGGLLLRFKELRTVGKPQGGDLIGIWGPYDVLVEHPLFVIEDSGLGAIGEVDGLAISNQEEGWPTRANQNPDYLVKLESPATTQ